MFGKFRCTVFSFVKISSIDSDSDTYSSNEDDDMPSVIADDLFEEDFTSKNCIRSLGN